MSLPPLYFRRRDGGATVFRVADETASGRLEMTPIAQISLRAGEIRPQGGREATPDEAQAMADWLAAEQRTLEGVGRDGAVDTLRRIGTTAHWVQTAASADDVRAVADELLLALHDLRQALLRRLSERPDGD